MTYTTEAIQYESVLPRGEHPIAIPAPGLWGITGRIRAAWGRYQTRQALELLEDRLLVDIGLNRDQIAELRSGRMPELPIKRRG
jgi:uncharacterized protein YjiS (DUF1127 family)